MDAWSIVIAMLVVVGASAAIRLTFYVWWRGRFGGRPVKRAAAKNQPRDDAEVVEWDQLERRDGPT